MLSNYLHDTTVYSIEKDRIYNQTKAALFLFYGRGYLDYELTQPLELLAVGWCDLTKLPDQMWPVVTG